MYLDKDENFHAWSCCYYSFNRFYSLVQVSNTEARRFYERHNFVETSRVEVLFLTVIYYLPSSSVSRQID